MFDFLHEPLGQWHFFDVIMAIITSIISIPIIVLILIIVITIAFPDEELKKKIEKEKQEERNAIMAKAGYNLGLKVRWLCMKLGIIKGKS